MNMDAIPDSGPPQDNSIPVVINWEQARPHALLGDRKCGDVFPNNQEVCQQIEEVDQKFLDLYEQLRTHATALKERYRALQDRLERMDALGIPASDPDRVATQAEMGDTKEKMDRLNEQLRAIPSVLAKVSSNLDLMRQGAQSISRVDDFKLEGIDVKEQKNFAKLLADGKRAVQLLQRVWELRRVESKKVKTNRNQVVEVVKNRDQVVKRMESLATDIENFADITPKTLPIISTNREVTVQGLKNSLDTKYTPKILESNAKAAMVGILDELFNKTVEINYGEVQNLLDNFIKVKGFGEADKAILGKLQGEYLKQASNPNEEELKQFILNQLADLLKTIGYPSDLQIVQTSDDSIIGTDFETELTQEELKSILLAIGALEWMSAKSYPMLNEYEDLEMYRSVMASYRDQMTSASIFVLDIINSMPQSVKNLMEVNLKTFGSPRYDSLAEWEEVFTGESISTKIAARQTMFVLLQRMILPNYGGDREAMVNDIIRVRAEYEQTRVMPLASQPQPQPEPSMPQPQPQPDSFPTMPSQQSPSGPFPTMPSQQSPSGPFPTMPSQQSPSGSFPTMPQPQSPSGSFPTMPSQQSPSGSFPTMPSQQSPSGSFPTMPSGEAQGIQKKSIGDQE